MENNNQKISNLQNLLDYDARKFEATEIQLKNILPYWINLAGSVMLKNVLQRYLDDVKKHVQKLTSFIEEEKITSLNLVNKVMSAFIEETQSKLASCADMEVKDACLLACVQSMNHYKISMYGTAAAFAQALGMEKAAAIFHDAEVNEKQIDDRLSQLAEHEINLKAKSPVVLGG